MNAVVVYESHWGSTAAVARAIAEGLGSEARALDTTEATAEAVARADLIVAGAPVLGFSLPTEQMIKNIGSSQGKAPAPADVSHPSMRSWLAGLPAGTGRYAAFETRIWWSFGGATSGISSGMEGAGYSELAKRERFIVTGGYGPLKEGEIERARAWGAKLASLAR
jgi:hypothetical protein